MLIATALCNKVGRRRFREFGWLFQPFGGCRSHGSGTELSGIGADWPGRRNCSPRGGRRNDQFTRRAVNHSPFASRNANVDSVPLSKRSTRTVLHGQAGIRRLLQPGTRNFDRRDYRPCGLLTPLLGQGHIVKSEREFRNAGSMRTILNALTPCTVVPRY